MIFDILFSKKILIAPESVFAQRLLCKCWSVAGALVTGQRCPVAPEGQLHAHLAVSVRNHWRQERRGWSQVPSIGPFHSATTVESPATECSARQRVVLGGNVTTCERGACTEREASSSSGGTVVDTTIVRSGGRVARVCRRTGILCSFVPNSDSVLQNSDGLFTQ